MDFLDLSRQITDLICKNTSIYMKIDPEVPDFTMGVSGKLTLGGLTTQIEIDFSPQTIMHLVGILDSTIFDPEHVKRLYAWNFKSFASYVYFNISKFVSPKNNLIDLKPLEHFLGIREPRPENLVEAITRAKVAISKSGWQEVYKHIHLPLTLRVLPSIESTPLLDKQKRLPVYPCYEIEGQSNGRMNCYKAFVKSYLPHNMSQEVKLNLKPRGYKLYFLLADFRHCEVNVLQWLSKDESLGQIIESGEDVHRRIYEVVTETSCDTDNKRKLSKLMFLPVMYGCGPATLAKNLSIKKEVGEILHQRIRSKFTTAVNWLNAQEELARRGEFKDYFGRIRVFKEDQTYLARNTAVQAVAATVCQEKLIELYRHLKQARLAFSVHDGYGIICAKQDAKQTFQEVKSALESESKLCPGLKMKAEIRFGANLQETKVLWTH